MKQFLLRHAFLLASALLFCLSAAFYGWKQQAAKTDSFPPVPSQQSEDTITLSQARNGIFAAFSKSGTDYTISLNDGSSITLPGSNAGAPPVILRSCSTDEAICPDFEVYLASEEYTQGRGLAGFKLVSPAELQASDAIIIASIEDVAILNDFSFQSQGKTVLLLATREEGSNE